MVGRQTDAFKSELNRLSVYSLKKYYASVRQQQRARVGEFNDQRSKQEGATTT
jgi:hypothetical protein